MSIGGRLDMAALATLSGSDPDQQRMQHFLTLDHQAQAAAIRRLAAAGQSVHVIAAATRLSVEAVTRLLEEPLAKPVGEAALGDPPTACPRTGVPMRFCTCIGPHA